MPVTVRFTHDGQDHGEAGCDRQPRLQGLRCAGPLRAVVSRQPNAARKCDRSGEPGGSDHIRVALLVGHSSSVAPVAPVETDRDAPVRMPLRELLVSRFPLSNGENVLSPRPMPTRITNTPMAATTAPPACVGRLLLWRFPPSNTSPPAMTKKRPTMTTDTYTFIAAHVSDFRKLPLVRTDPMVRPCVSWTRGR